jgi:deazaflavin-dependent oxidoreductase (nitroreductase family)
MPLPKSIARLASHRFNPIARPIVRRLPGFAIVIHQGRTSGKIYETPIVAFNHHNQVVFALTYGPSTDWVQNVLAAGICTLVRRSTPQDLTNPRLLHDPTRSPVPRLVRVPLSFLDVDDFLIMDGITVSKS